MPRLVMLLSVALVACTPTLDWREVRPEGSGITALFPCHPKSQSRQLMLAGKHVSMSLYACSAAGVTWGLAFADVTDPSRVTPALEALRDATSANLAAAAAASAAAVVDGMTPNVLAQRIELAGKHPDGHDVPVQMMLFTKGTRVFQATIVGRTSAEATEGFFGALRLVS